MIRLRRTTPLLLVAALACGPGDEASAGTDDGPIRIAAGPDGGVRLQTLLDTLSDSATVELEAGRYVLEPVPYEDPACGNCEDATERVPATRGLRLTGSAIRLVGDTLDPGSVVIETRAGYGVLFDGCTRCSLRGITVTGGARDPDGRATSAGIVVRGGPVVVEDCRITDNLGDSAIVHGETIAGVAGVAVREGGDLQLRRCEITRNSWDGVALYRGANAIIEDNLIDGVDAASGGRHGGGRGVGIGVTWDGRASILGNRVTRYWKGIGAFVDARVDVRLNVVEEILTWGLAYWGPEGGRPEALFRDNVVYGTGACGVIVDRAAPAAEGEDPGGLVGNLIVATGRNEAYDSGEPYCLQRPIARHAVPEGFEIEGNVLFDARQPGDEPREALVERAALAEAANDLLPRLTMHAPTRFSAFLAWLDGG